MKEMKFFRCRHCGNVAWKPYDANTPLSCCGELMQEMLPGTVDASLEKHVPVIETNGNMATVKVGSIEHPMLPEHFIGIIALQTADNAVQFTLLKEGEKPQATFSLEDASKPMTAYEWCNLHGLWKTEK